ncbi:MAG: glycosyltransferase [Culicoidibacterales bacterium]
MKKILIVMNALIIGGSEKSLVSLLGLIDYTQYEVDLLMLKRGGAFEQYVPEQVNILPVPEYYQWLNGASSNSSVSKQILFWQTRLRTMINLRLNARKKVSINTEQVLYRSQKAIFDNVEKTYDVAIAYSQGMPTYLVADKVKAKKKIAWINCDYQRTMYDKQFDKIYYDQIEAMVAVSEYGKKSIEAVYAEYAKKTKVILDVVDPQFIRNLANEDLVFTGEKLPVIVTVARLVIHHKGYDLAIQAAANLKAKGYQFKWYVVGEGPDRAEIESLIASYKVEDVFILLGEKHNPYPYMANATLYVQTSVKEGLGLTVVEAKILQKPIVCTNFETAKEIIEDQETGLIVPISVEGITQGIEKYFNDSAFKQQIEYNLTVQNAYNTLQEVDKFYQILSE